jgi:hypothetical protein
MSDTTIEQPGEVETYEVGGVRMPRPFKIRRFGHFGWDGRPRPADLRPSITQPWPHAVDTQPDTYVGQTYLGPLG